MLFDRHEDCWELRRTSWRGLLTIAIAIAIVPAASAQKYRGTTLDDVPAQKPYVPPAPRAAPSPAPSPIPREAAPPSRPLATAPREGDGEARALADRLPLDPATANLQGRNPADVPGTIRQLGLRVPNGPRTNLQSHTPSTRELVDALRH